VADDPMIGRIHGPNLTRGRGGIGATLDDEAWIRAIRHGVGRNGRGLLLMPAEDYAAFSRADLGGLIVFAKSVPPVDREWSAPRLGPLGRFLVAIGEIELSADRIDHAAVTPSEVPVGESPEYGRYLAMSCTGCHGADLSGGRIAGAPPDWPPARNLTPDPASGLKSWTQADFFNALRAGRRPDGAEIHPAMPRSFGLMTDEEIRALWMYLETLPPVAAAR
jgi:cytochrome c553